MRRLLDPLSLVVVAVATFALLGYVSWGEASRVYPELRLERTRALAGVMAGEIEAFAKVGLPLREFRGFEPLAKPVLAIERAVTRIALVGPDGVPIFALDRGEAMATPQPETRPSGGGGSTTAVGLLQRLARPSGAYAVELPVRSRFERVGALVVEVDRRPVATRVLEAVAPALPAAAAMLILIYAAVLAGRWTTRVRARLIGEVAFAAGFVAVSAVLLLGLFRLYAEGVESKAQGLAASMAERLSVATELGLGLDGLTGIEELLEQYRANNPDVHTIRLHRAGAADLIAPAGVSPPGPNPGDFYRFAEPLERTGDPPAEVEVTVPASVVLDKLWRGGRMFAILFLACGLIALYALGAVQAAPAAVPRPPRPPPLAVGERSPESDAETDARLAVLRPAYFLAVLVDSLVMPFLPQFARSLAAARGLDASMMSLPFSVYFVGLTLALVPTGRLARRLSLKTLLLGGLAFVAAGAALVWSVPDFAALVVGRFLSGAGQGVLLIAVQTYALEVTPETRRTRAASIQVQGYNAGLIAGAAIGGLLVIYLQERGVFLVGAGIALAAILYAALFVAEIRVVAPAPRRGRSLGADLLYAVSDRSFLSLLVLVGIVSKFVLAGVVFFGLPLLLDGLGFNKEDIGQVVMVFAGVTLVATSLAASVVDRVGSAARTLAVGTTCAGLGMLVLALTSLPAASAWLEAPSSGHRLVAVVLAGVALLGLAQGLTAAPAITQVSQTRVARVHGRAAAISVYRLLERTGHITGPMVVGALLSGAAGGEALVVAGAMVLACGPVYLLLQSSPVEG